MWYSLFSAEKTTCDIDCNFDALQYEVVYYFKLCLTLKVFFFDQVQ